MREATQLAMSTGLFLMAVGVIAAFAVGDRLDIYDATTLGYGCIAAGALAFVCGGGVRLWAAVVGARGARGARVAQGDRGDQGDRVDQGDRGAR